MIRIEMRNRQIVIVLFCLWSFLFCFPTLSTNSQNFVVSVMSFSEPSLCLITLSLKLCLRSEYKNPCYYQVEPLKIPNVQSFFFNLQIRQFQMFQLLILVDEIQKKSFHFKNNKNKINFIHHCFIICRNKINPFYF